MGWIPWGKHLLVGIHWLTRVSHDVCSAVKLLGYYMLKNGVFSMVSRRARDKG